jgi:hypothetical protein
MRLMTTRSTNPAADPRFFVELPGRKPVRVQKFHTLSFAQDASRIGTHQMLVLGDIGDKWGPYWVASYRDAARLVDAGFEYAP